MRFSVIFQSFDFSVATDKDNYTARKQHAGLHEIRHRSWATAPIPRCAQSNDGTSLVYHLPNALSDDIQVSI